MQYQQKLQREHEDQVFFNNIDLFFGLGYLAIAVFSIYQLVSQSSPLIIFSASAKKSMKVITLFNLLIAISCVTCSIWFFLPNNWMYKYYLSNAIECQETNFYNLFSMSLKQTSNNHQDDDKMPENDLFFSLYHLQEKDLSGQSVWEGKFWSEVLVMLNMLTLYSIFLLISSYWYFMNKKVEILNRHTANEGTEFLTNLPYQQPTYSSHDPSHAMSTAFPQNTVSELSPAEQSYLQDGKWEFGFQCLSLRVDALGLFYAVFLLFGIMNAILLLGFYENFYNSQQLLLIRCFLSILICVIIYIKMNECSRYVMEILQVMAATNPASTATQIQRIQGITVVANIFALSHMLLDSCMCFYLLYGFQSTHSSSFAMNPVFFKLYFVTRSFLEMMVLFFELIIAIPIKSYETRPAIPLPNRFYSEALSRSEEESSLLSTPSLTRQPYYRGIAYRDFHQTGEDDHEIDANVLVNSTVPTEFYQRRYPAKTTELTPILRGDSLSVQKHDIQYV